MATGRVPLLVLLGIARAAAAPDRAARPAWWVLAVLLLVGARRAARAAARRRWRSPGDRSGRSGRASRPSDLAGRGQHRRRAGSAALLRDAWQPSAGRRPATGTGSTSRPATRSRLTTPLTPTRRGDRRADRVTVRMHRAARPGRTAALASTCPGAVRVLPPFHSRKHLPSRLARLRELDGRAAVRVRGQGTEFDSLREYVRGDDVRSIDWRASARTRNVVVRTWQPERHRRVLLVLDTSRTSAGRVDDVPRLDSAMDAALLLAALAVPRRGPRRLPRRRPAGPGPGPRRRRAATRSPQLVDAMADLEPVIAEADWSRLAARGRRRSAGSARSSCCSPPLEPAAVEQGLLPALPALAHRHRVVLASVRDPELERMAAAAAATPPRCTTRPPPSRCWPTGARTADAARRARRRRGRRRRRPAAGRADRPLPDAQGRGLL